MLTGRNRGQAGQTEVLAAQLTLQQAHVPSEERSRLMVVTHGVVDPPQRVMHHDLETEITESVGEREPPLAGLESPLLITHVPKSCGQVEECPPQTTLIAEGLGETFGFSHVCKE